MVSKGLAQEADWIRLRTLDRDNKVQKSRADVFLVCSRRACALGGETGGTWHQDQSRGQSAGSCRQEGLDFILHVAGNDEI